MLQSHDVFTDFLSVLNFGFFLVNSKLNKSKYILQNHENFMNFELIVEFKKDIKTVETFRIQIYSGSSSFTAEKVRSEFRNKYGEWPTEMVFNTPNYKI